MARAQDVPLEHAAARVGHEALNPGATMKMPTAKTVKPQILVVSGALISPDHTLLLASRPDGKDYAGKWETPGGKVEPGESPQRALVRELAEELGIVASADALRPMGFSTVDRIKDQIVVLLFRVPTWAGDPEPRDGQFLKWVPAHHLINYPMTPGSDALRAHYLRALRD